MSLTSDRAARKKAALRDRYVREESDAEIKAYLLGEPDEDRFWDLSQVEANEIVKLRQEAVKAINRGAFFDSEKEFAALMESLRAAGKSPGARYIAARIWTGAEPDLRLLARDWFAHRNIKRELSKDELKEIGARAFNLRRLGIQFRWQARAFYNLYREVRVKNRVWGSPRQVDQGRVSAIALTPNYNRLPLWVKKAMIDSDHWIESGDNVRIGNIWRFIDCAKAWKHAPSLAKGLAEKVGKMSIKVRLLAGWAWSAVALRFNFYERDGFRQLHEFGWEMYGQEINRAEVVNAFWQELKRLCAAGLPALIAERRSHAGHYLPEDHNKLRQIAELTLGLPYGYLVECWGPYKKASSEVYLEAIASHSDVKEVCRNLFGFAGKATVKAFRDSTPDAWQWAAMLCDGNADAAQKIMLMRQIIPFEDEAVDFLKSLPIVSRIRMLGTTTFKYRGEIHPVTPDYVRDTGYLWKNIRQKPELGRVRCWFSVHTQLVAAFVKELPDGPLPVPAEWERVDGLCAVDGMWEIEFPKRVAMLKYYGEVLHNCVGAYGPAIEHDRRVIFVVKEKGIPTHCVEIVDGYVIRQFYRSGNTNADCDIESSVCAALKQAGYPVRRATS